MIAGRPGWQVAGAAAVKPPLRSPRAHGAKPIPVKARPAQYTVVSMHIDPVGNVGAIPGECL